MTRRVISQRHQGIGDCLVSTAHAWYYARATGRTLVICWAPSLYLSDPSCNAFTAFFEVPTHIVDVPVVVEPTVKFVQRTLRRLPLTPFRWFAPTILSSVLDRFIRRPAFVERFLVRKRQWTDQFLTEARDVSSRTVYFSSCLGTLSAAQIEPFFRSLRLRPSLQTQIDEFASRHFSRKHVLGVHVRYHNSRFPNYDSAHAPYWADEAAALSRIGDLIDRAIREAGDGPYVIFLATDGRPVHDYVRARFPGAVTYEKQLGVKGDRELQVELGVETAEATILEMFLLARSHTLVRFPPSRSWFSHYASLYAERVIDS